MVKVLSFAQQPTSICFLENVNEASKKLTSLAPERPLQLTSDVKTIANYLDIRKQLKERFRFRPDPLPSLCHKKPLCLFFYSLHILHAAVVVVVVVVVVEVVVVVVVEVEPKNFQYSIVQNEK